MNLNQFDRQAFVRAVMADVPMIDYQEQANAIAKAAMLNALPKEVLAAYKLHPELISHEQVHLPNGFTSVRVPCKSDNWRALERNHQEVWAELTTLVGKAREQSEAREGLKEKLTAAIGACRTLKQARERLPEFEKYLPTERGNTGTANLPVVANLVADLTKAGWPKDKNPSKGKK